MKLSAGVSDKLVRALMAALTALSSELRLVLKTIPKSLTAGSLGIILVMGVLYWTRGAKV